MERFLIGFFGSLLLMAFALLVIALMTAAFYFLGPLGGFSTVALAAAVLAGVCNYFDRPSDEPKEA